MRACRTIELGPGRDATIYEARVCDIRRLVAFLPNDPAGVDLLSLVHSHLAEVLDILNQCIKLPANVTIDDLSISECEKILSIWWEMHADFFLRALAAIGYAPASAKDS